MLDLDLSRQSSRKQFKPNILEIDKDLKMLERRKTISISDKLIEKLFSDIDKEQIKETTPYSSFLGRFPPDQWSMQKGLYKSFVRMNLKGKASAIRPFFKIPDNNAFVTMFVNQFKLEALENNSHVKLDEESYKDALKAISTHKDHNRNGEAIYRFWNQKPIDGNSVSWPENMAIPLTQADLLLNALSPVANLLPKKIGEIDRENVKKFVNFPAGMLQGFCIPADSDDTFVNLGLMARMAAHSDSLPEMSNQRQVSKIAKQATNELVKYAYRPFADDKDYNLIDSRTYHWLSDFIYEEKKRSTFNLRKPNLCLPTTWLQNYSENKISFKKKESMPFGVNNVDGSVAANVLFGITSAYLLEKRDEKQKIGANNNSRNNTKESTPCVAPELEWFDNNVKKMYLDTSKMLAWILKKDLMSHKEKSREILMYYPSVYDFYYFTARVNHLLENPEIISSKNRLPNEKVLSYAKKELGNALRGPATEQLLRKCKIKDGKWAVWDDKLGDSDTDVWGRPQPKADDRLFSTSGALNALLDIWTTSEPLNNTKANQTKIFKRKWRADVPLKVKETILAGSRFLKDHVSKESYGGLSLDNVFFSGSTHAGLPMARPCNVREDLNGKELPKDAPFPDIPTPKLGGHVHGVAGVIPKDNYKMMLKELKKNGYYNPSAAEQKMDSEGALKTPFPFWSSPSITMGLTMLALLKVKNLD